jgi:hypothetical protein
LTLVVASLLLYVAAYQVWVDEHNNTAGVIKQRVDDVIPKLCTELCFIEDSSDGCCLIAFC